ncbi:hypothetical protein [Zavarzinia compransoris]|uniref:Isomerase n=1 Tax=Zavarzinia compransoris TaxID=1264899 RepID=A0A317E474_9PROT|nr:hypothetical protein [Zavarzinia compransoris]PWR19855.1 hypothetical protein DKG75_15480 [Zavarzinia compransoris]TDP45034.1 hypothetical protein DES42_106256 [Zavarzinia compransoris]
MQGLSLDARRLAGHGALVVVAGLVAGFFIGFVALGGFILDPLPSARFEFPGSERGWRAMHVGSILNGVMALTVAALIDRVVGTEKVRRLIVRVLTLAIWANTLFYLAANFAANRGLSPWDNAAGPGSLWGLVAFLPAAIAAGLTIWVMLLFARAAFSAR